MSQIKTITVKIQAQDSLPRDELPLDSVELRCFACGRLMLVVQLAMVEGEWVQLTCPRCREWRRFVVSA